VDVFRGKFREGTMTVLGVRERLTKMSISFLVRVDPNQVSLTLLTVEAISL
jgi:hypothetical protein